MKRKTLNEFLMKETERKRTIIGYSISALLLTFITIFLLCATLSSSLDKKVKYTEDSEINYNVFLKDNDYYNTTFIEKDNQYVASLIDYITADFKYSIRMKEKNIKFSYTYTIIADAIVKEKENGNVLYKYSEPIISEKSYADNITNSIKINEKIVIDYNKYNDLINNYIKEYNLSDTESLLSVKLVVDTISSCQIKESKTTSISNLSLNVPLNKKTVAIDLTTKNKKANNSIIVCKSDINLPLLMITIIIALMDAVVISILIKYVKDTRTAETVYEVELKKILKTYHAYIQKINNDFVFNGYQVLYVDQFTDLLDIRKTISEPILMATAPKDKGTFFIVPSKTKILYVYSLRISDIKRNITNKKKR